jgi:hypothetical protein
VEAAALSWEENARFLRSRQAGAGGIFDISGKPDPPFGGIEMTVFSFLWAKPGNIGFLQPGCMPGTLISHNFRRGGTRAWQAPLQRHLSPEGRAEPVAQT